MATNALTHLMFEGKALEAMHFYISLLPKSKIVSCQLYESGEMQGKVQQAQFELCGRRFMCIDSPVKHAFTFTPAMSIFIEFDSESALTEAFKQLSKDGSTLMGLNNYGFSKLFGWVSDRFGVSWQLNLN